MTASIVPRSNVEARAIRLVTVVLAVMALVVAVTWSVALTPGDAPGGYRVVLAAVLALPASLALIAIWLPIPAVRVIAGLLAVATLLLAVALLVDAADGNPLEGRALWPLSITAVATTAAVIAAGPLVASSVLAVLTVSFQMLRALTGGTDPGWLVNDAQALLTSIVVLVLVTMFLRATRALDRVVDRALEAEAERASADGRRLASQRAQALVHDEV
ncbi:MAG: hypothetical protein ACTH31_15305, partial [Pseudoclavibacter sp.]